MKNILIKTLSLTVVLALVAGCASARPATGATAPAVPKFMGTPNTALKYEKTEAYLLVGKYDDPEKNAQARMASQMDLGYSWWMSFQVKAGKVMATANFSTRKSQLISERQIDAPGWSAMVQKLELEVSEVSGVPGSPSLHRQEIALEGVKSPEALLMTSRMELLLGLGKESGWVRLAGIESEPGKLILTWDVRF